MPHITNPAANGRIRELNTDEGWMKYVPPEGGRLDTYSFDNINPKFSKLMEQVQYFINGYITVAEITEATDTERNLIQYGSETAPPPPPEQQEPSGEE
jgi:hypothetical protein